ncbi:TonB-linked outer membrane protein, SusC/RagA family [Chitinophaga jiangningensis]|uniref:TonB-linked outer membrane protein, SusC/RagA family n=1 Tax=Chitinophaga jiangningensis TaxID=1419482 RepID=A0A1M7G2V7_9BACT|nr:TonB-dependent receptor [Chitinophaga jiangningensis]SHM10583.1 TonB-linked outer membrane protein, SusC/RagA family [Chitinophaga jiangningensis]
MKGKLRCIFKGHSLPVRTPVLALKLIMLLLIALQVSAVNNAQGLISLKSKHIAIDEAFKQIERRTTYRFYYSKEDFSSYKPLDIAIENASIDQALKVILGETDISWKIMNDTKVVLFKAGNKAVSPAAIIHGTITDSKGDPIPGVSVVIKGTTKGTTTGGNGTFTLEAADGATLVVSAIGFTTQEIKLTGEKELHIKLEVSSININEVVAIAYGVQKRVNLSGSVNTLNKAQIVNRPVTSLTNSLQGLIPGMVVMARPGDVGSDIGTINVRGRGNLGTSSPLYIVDGVPVTAGDFARINGSDVESMSVLKDAAASSLYGSRASFGVILVTTKKGKSGKPTVQYNGYYGFQKALVLPKWLGSYDYATLSNEAATNAGGTPVYNATQLDKIKNGTSPDSFPNTDWYSLALRNSAPITEHQVSVSGGGTTRYYFSGAFLKQGSLIPDKDLKRYSFRSNVESQVSEKLKVGTNLSFIRDEINSESGALSFVSLNRVTPLLVNKQSNGEWGSINGGVIDATLAKDNPVRMLQEGGRSSSGTNRFIGNLTGTYTPVKDLEIIGLFSYNNFNYDSSQFVNRMDPINNFNTGVPIASTAVTVNALGESWQNTTNLLAQLTAGYSKKIGKHSGQILAGTSFENNKARYIRVIRKNFVTNGLDAINAGSTDPLNTTAAGGIQQYALFSVFGRLNYTYNDKYILEANLRGDESSRFAPGHRWGYYPSFSGAWRIGQEDFMKNNRVIYDLKLRGSWGKLGNINNVGNYDFYDGLVSSTVGILDEKQQDGVSPGKLANPNLSWEKTTMANIGVDAGFLQNKLSLQLDVFHKVTNDILLQDASVPYEAGLTDNQLPSKNMGSVQNRGIELTLAYSDRIGDFNYSVGGNFSKVQNKILSLNNQGTDNINSYYIQRVGGAVGDFYMYQADGLFVTDAEVAKHAKQFSGTKAGDIKYVDQDGDNAITAEDRVVTGNDVPYLTYGLNASASYKNFDFSIIGQGVSGVKVYLESEASQAFFNGAGVKQYVLGRWTAANPDPNAAYPRVLRSAANSQNLQMSSFWLFNADYFRIKSLSIGYTIPDRVMQRAHMQKLRIYMSSNNPFTIRGDKRMKDFDPESASTRAGYPQLKSWSFGINLTL